MEKGRDWLLYHSLRGLHLIDKVPKAQAVHDLMGLQSQFSDNPRVSLHLRASDYDARDWGKGLVKIWCHRNTMHLVAEEEMGLYLAASDRLGPFEDAWWGMTAADMEKWSPFILEEIAKGNDTREGLKAACRSAGMTEEMCKAAFYGWGGLIKELCYHGKIAGYPGNGKRYRIMQGVDFPEKTQARLTLIDRYFDVFGPASAEDCRAFFGRNKGEMKEYLDKLLPGYCCSDIGGIRCYHKKPLDAIGDMPECVLLPGFDQLILGYGETRFRAVAEANRKKIVNMAGIVFPGVIVRGQIRAQWKQEAKKVCVTPFEKLLKKDRKAITREAEKKLGADTVIFNDPE